MATGSRSSAAPFDDPPPLLRLDQDSASDHDPSSFDCCVNDPSDSEDSNRGAATRSTLRLIQHMIDTGFPFGATPLAPRSPGGATLPGTQSPSEATVSTFRHTRTHSPCLNEPFLGRCALRVPFSPLRNAPLGFFPFPPFRHLCGRFPVSACYFCCLAPPPGPRFATS